MPLLPSDSEALLALAHARWSPYAYADTPVTPEDLRAVFEVTRWAPSSFNEQPWRFVVGVRGEGSTWDCVLDALNEKNATWARHAPVLGIAYARTAFARNDRPNRWARHDVGAALAFLALAATARGLALHAMAGFDADEACRTLDVPTTFEPVTAFALGHPAATGTSDVPDELAGRDEKRRDRRPLAETVFTASGEAPGWVETEEA